MFVLHFYCVGCRDKIVGQTLKNLIQTDYFRVNVVDDVEAVEVCGALKVCLFKKSNFVFTCFNIFLYVY